MRISQLYLLPVPKNGKPAFVVRQGSVFVKAYRYGNTNRFQLSYYRFPGDKLQRITKPGERLARERARQIAVELANGRAQVLELTSIDRENYLYASRLLSGTPLSVAAEEWAYARKLLPSGVSLAEAVDYYNRKNVVNLFGYPEPPQPAVRASKRTTLPAASGVYFVWIGSRCVYVGKSWNLATRCVIGKDHPNIRSEDEMLSWIEEPPMRLEIMEAFYIGALRPERNFMRSKKAETSPPGLPRVYTADGDSPQI